MTRRRAGAYHLQVAHSGIPLTPSLTKVVR